MSALRRAATCAAGPACLVALCGARRGGLRPLDCLGVRRPDGRDPADDVCEHRVDGARGKGTADRIIDRYGLTGGGAEAVRDIFSPPGGTSTSVGIIGLLFLLVAVLRFSRAVQRLFEQTWELDPLSVRNTFNGLLWIGGLALYIALSGILHAALGRSRLELDRIRRGEKRADDEVRRQWDEVTAEARSRWDALRLQIHDRRHRRGRA